ncbi:MAG: glucokinase [Elainellaceae cyanobacterium]
MTLLLAGDIGGTKTILRLVDAEENSTAAGAALKTLYEDRYSSPDYPDLAPIVRKFLKDAADATGISSHPKNACFAIAGPVVKNTSSLTNLSWRLDGDRLKDQLNLTNVALINDFAAVGYGVLGLRDDDLRVLQKATSRPDAPIAVIGAGTGLGEGFLIPNGRSGYNVFPSEGGHADFAPRSQLEFQLLNYLLDKFKITRISVERVVSGQGIVAIYQFLRDRETASESPPVADVIRTWERQTGQEKTVDPAAVISKAAADGSDHLSEQAMNMFAEAYGAEAGNLALKLLPHGGLFIAGGIAAKNLELIESGGFMRAFADKGRVSSLLEDIPVQIVLNPKVGLIGAALYAAKL